MRLPRPLRDDFGQREIRTYGRKNGFVTRGQAERLARLLPRLCLERGERLSATSFAKRGPVVMEIGFGNGEFLACLARSRPHWNLFGIEVYLPGVAKALARMEDAGALDRLRISTLPAEYVLAHQVPTGMLAGVYINHPDPWPKARHAKRRLVQPDFARLLSSRLAPGGFLKLATDWPELAAWMRDVLDATLGLRNLYGQGAYAPRDPGRIATKFERRGLKDGRVSLFLHYERMAS